MSIFAFAVPYQPPPPPLPPWRGYNVTWTGWDGTEWDLTDWRSSGVCLTGDFEGLLMPVFEDYTSRSPLGSGQRFRGTRIAPRRITFSVLVFSDIDSDAWVQLNSAFWYSMRPDLPGTLTVTGPTGKTVSIQCRLTPTTPHVFGRDPAKDGWTLYQPDFTADDPLWYGPEEPAVEWRSAPSVQQPFIPTSGGPPFYITNLSEAANATLRNPGDVPIWVRWLVEGPLTLTITVGGGVIKPPVVADGKTLEIQTDPRIGASAKLTDLATGAVTDVFKQFTRWAPRKLPVGAEVPVGLELLGTGAVTGYYRPGYFIGL